MSQDTKSTVADVKGPEPTAAQALFDYMAQIGNRLATAEELKQLELLQKAAKNGPHLSPDAGLAMREKLIKSGAIQITEDAVSAQADHKQMADAEAAHRQVIASFPDGSVKHTPGTARDWRVVVKRLDPLVTGPRRPDWHAAVAKLIATDRYLPPEVHTSAMFSDLTAVLRRLVPEEHPNCAAVSTIMAGKEA